MIATLLALAISPPIEFGEAPLVHHYRSFNVHVARKAGCHVSQVHVPAGKLGHAPAVIRCPAPVEALEAGWQKRAPLRG